MIKRLVCLANSRKSGGRCIAGRELLAGNVGEWIRPVSGREHEEVSARERKYEDGGDPRVLDIIDVPLVGRKANPYQSENWLLNSNAYWSKAGEFRRDYLSFLASVPGPLWANGRHTRNGQNDYVAVEEIDKTDGSLKLIAASNGLQLHVYRPGEDFDNPRRRVQAEFSFGGISYCLWATDPLVETEYLAQVDGVYTLRSSYLTISLGEPWDGHCYKLVAAIIGANL